MAHLDNMSQKFGSWERDIKRVVLYILFYLYCNSFALKFLFLPWMQSFFKYLNSLLIFIFLENESRQRFRLSASVFINILGYLTIIDSIEIVKNPLKQMFLARQFYFIILFLHMIRPRYRPYLSFAIVSKRRVRIVA